MEIVVDTSALVAILYAEEDAASFAQALLESEVCAMSTATFVETGIVIDRQRGPAAGRQLDQLIARADIVLEPVTAMHAALARQAYLEYGKGVHPASLNFGDCFSYALARASGRPLLFKGEDFARTDVVQAPRST